MGGAKYCGCRGAARSCGGGARSRGGVQDGVQAVQSFGGAVEAGDNVQTAALQPCCPLPLQQDPVGCLLLLHNINQAAS